MTKTSSKIYCKIQQENKDKSNRPAVCKYYTPWGKSALFIVIFEQYFFTGITPRRSVPQVFNWSSMPCNATAYHGAESDQHKHIVVPHHSTRSSIALVSCCVILK